MADFPALPIWTDAYLADTRHLSTVEHGAYLLLMMEAWRRPSCSLPNDDALLARLAGLNHNEWGAIKDTVLALWKLDEKRNVFVQKRLSKEREFLDKKRVKNKQSAASRWNKKEKGDANAMQTQCQNDAPTPTPTPTPTVKKDPSDPKKGKRLPPDFTPDLQAAVEMGLRPERAISEAASFKDYWIAQPGSKGVKLDWPATWRNWVRKALERQSGPRGSPSQTRYQEGADRVRQDLERSARGEDDGKRDLRNTQPTFDLDPTDYRRR